MKIRLKQDINFRIDHDCEVDGGQYKKGQTILLKRGAHTVDETTAEHWYIVAHTTGKAPTGPKAIAPGAATHGLTVLPSQDANDDGEGGDETPAPNTSKNKKKGK